MVKLQQAASNRFDSVHSPPTAISVHSVRNPYLQSTLFGLTSMIATPPQTKPYLQLLLLYPLSYLPLIMVDMMQIQAISMERH